MNNQTSSFLFRANNLDRPLNILCSAVHERYAENLALTGHNFYLCHHPSFRKWDNKYAKIPKNHFTLDDRLPIEKQIPDWLNIDVILSGNKWDNFQVLCPLSFRMGIPFVQVEHTGKPEFYDKNMTTHMKNMRGHANVFITEWSLKSWEWDNFKDTYVIRHCIDTNLFKPRIEFSQRDVACLSVANDFINRDYFLNYKLWAEGTKGFPVKLYGHTPGLSERASSTEFLANEYSKTLVFVNTSRISPIPMSLLEAASSACICITSSTCGIPECFKNEYNCLFADTPEQLRNSIKRVLDSPEKYYYLGENARKTILERFNESLFIEKWNHVLRGLI